MNILAIDSSSGNCSVAIWQDGSVRSYHEELSAVLQAKRLVIMVEEALTESKLAYGDLASIAVTVGPGSFTGIRIALAAARGIGLAADVPVLGYSGLLVMAFGANRKHPDKRITAALNAGKGEIIYQDFGADLEATCEPSLKKTEHSLEHSSKNEILVGYNSGGDITFPRADLLAMLAAEYPQYGVEPLPFYVRPPDAKLPNTNPITALPRI